MTMIISGSGTISGLVAGGLPDATITQPDLAANVAGNGPAFSAYQSSNQTISSSTWTKVQLQTKEWDTASCFDNTTNYRFTPNVAGYYQINAQVLMTATSAWGVLAVYKNGSNAKYGNNVASSPNGLYCACSTTLYMNGTTDYIEMYALQGTGANSTISINSNATSFQAFLARSA